MTQPNIFTAVRDIERLRQILGVLVKHGFGEVVARTPLAGLVSTKGTGTTLSLAERLRMIATELGPSFIKLGQVLSTRADLLPADVIRELKVLQDRVPPIAFEELRRVVESELGSPIDELFEVFEREPLASASVGQVHRARLKTEYNGVREVVVKVQRPNIRSMIECDLELLHLIASAIERAIPESRVYQPKKLVSEFDRAISAELDFLLEADNALRFLKNFADVPYARFPRVIREFSTRRVLVLEYIEGKKVYDAVAEGFDPEQIARTALAIAIKSIFEDGFFHADPHPGNVLILGTPSAPVIGLIDLGLVGRLTPHLRDKTIDLMVAAIQEDHRGIADALCAMGTLTKKIDRREFEAEVAMLSQKYLGKTLGEIDVGGLIRDLVQGAQKYGIEIPPDFLLVGKALMTLEGVGREIAPRFDLYSEMKPYFLRLLKERYAPDRLVGEALRSLGRMTVATTEMPIQLQEILEDLRKGRFQLHVHNSSQVLQWELLGRRLYSGLVVASLVVGSAILLAQGSQWKGVAFLILAALWGSSHVILAWFHKRSGMS